MHAASAALKDQFVSVVRCATVYVRGFCIARYDLLVDVFVIQNQNL